MTEKIEFTSIDEYRHGGRVVYICALPVELTSQDGLTGKAVLIDGVDHTVLGTVLNMHSPPWHAGETIGLWVTG